MIITFLAETVEAADHCFVKLTINVIHVSPPLNLKISVGGEYKELLP